MWHKSIVCVSPSELQYRPVHAGSPIDPSYASQVVTGDGSHVPGRSWNPNNPLELVPGKVHASDLYFEGMVTHC